MQNIEEITLSEINKEINKIYSKNKNLDEIVLYLQNILSKFDFKNSCSLSNHFGQTIILTINFDNYMVDTIFDELTKKYSSYSIKKFIVYFTFEPNNTFNMLVYADIYVPLEYNLYIKENKLMCDTIERNKDTLWSWHINKDLIVDEPLLNLRDSLYYIFIKKNEEILNHVRISSFLTSVFERWGLYQIEKLENIMIFDGFVLDNMEDLMESSEFNEYIKKLFTLLYKKNQIELF